MTEKPSLKTDCCNSMNGSKSDHLQKTNRFPMLPYRAQCARHGIMDKYQGIVGIGTEKREPCSIDSLFLYT